MIGLVRTVKNQKGYGFIVDGDGIDHFFHRSEFKGHWNDLCDDFDNNVKIAVMFEADTPGERGPRAKNVRRTDHPNQA